MLQDPDTEEAAVLMAGGTREAVGAEEAVHTQDLNGEKPSTLQKQGAGETTHPAQACAPPAPPTNKAQPHAILQKRNIYSSPTNTPGNLTIGTE